MYIQGTRRPGRPGSLNGIQSRPTDRRVALAGVQSRPTDRRVVLGGLGSLGDTDPAAPMTEAEWRSQMLASQAEMTAWQKQWVQKDELQRWLQLAAVVSLPVIAAVWKLIGKRRGWNL